MIRVIDVFSGIGGFSLGLESTGGFETVAFCEIEPFPREVLAVHWPEVPCFTDVRELKLSPGDADMIVGGFPCQDISVAGKGAGIEGERSGLWRELFRLVQECRPRWVLVENVSALRTRGADRVLSDLEAEGYACWPLVVGAWAVGAPHRRERVWIVAHLAGAGQLRTPQLEDGGEGQRGERRPNATERRALPRASELSNSDAGRCGREEHALQAGRDEPERTASGVGLADRDQRRRKGKRYTYRDARSPLHSQSFGNDADGRGKWPVGSPTGAGLEGQRADAGEPQEPQPGDASTYGLDLSEAIAGGVVARLLGTDAGIRGGTRHHAGNVVTGDATVAEPEGERRPQQGHGRDAGPRPGCDGPRWPARPGEPQHEWEESRLAFAGSTDAAGRTSLGGRRGRTSNAQGHGTGAGDVSRSPQQPLGGPTARLLEQLVRCVVVTDGKTGQAGPAEVLRLVQSLTDEEAFQRAARRPLSVSGATLLRLAMHGGRQGNGRARSRNAALTDSAGDSAQAVLRAMSLDARTTAASQEPGQDGQPSRERADAVRVLPRERPLEEREAQILLDYLMNERLARRANRESLKALGNSVVPQVVAAIGRAILRVEADE